jgi:hypothetical protein
MQAESAPASLPWRLFWVAFLVRVAFITIAHTYKVRPFMDHFNFGWEMGRIARALATGHGFADPFDGHTGPTAWTPPLYPLLLGAVFKLFGVYTNLSGWVILTINSLFSATTAPAVYHLARLVFARGTGTRATDGGIALWSGWLWALYPAAMQYAIHWVWDMAVTTCFFTWILVLALRLRATYEIPAKNLRHSERSEEPLYFECLGNIDVESARGERPTTLLWLAFGTLWGLVALTNSSLLTFLPFCGLWIVWPLLQSRPAKPSQILRATRNALLAAICCLAFITPWIARNALVFHAFIPMRSNFGAELYESVLPSNEGFPWGGIFPEVGDDPKFVLYRQMGELAFSRDQVAQAKAIIRAHPARTLGYIAKRIWFYWAGVPHPVEKTFNSKFNEAIRQLDYCFLSVASILGLILAFRRRIPAAWLFFWMLAIIPLLFYAITVQARFRAPLEPAMAILIVYLFQSAERDRKVEMQISPGSNYSRR